MKIAERHLRPDVQPTLFRKSRRELDNYKRRGHKKQYRRKNPQADRRLSIARRGRDPARPQHSRNAEQQHIPETHHAAKLLFYLGGSLRRLTQVVTSSAGINSSCRRKF